MSEQSVYLAGPIAGCTHGEANDWRQYVGSKLAPYRIKGVSPLRCEPLIGERYATPFSVASSVDPKFGTARAISSKNKSDVLKCDLTFCFLPRLLNEARPSYGTVVELAWASMADKPTILVTDDPYLGNHPVIGACAGWILPALDDGIEVVLGLLSVYAENPHEHPYDFGNAGC